jgi:hypothetical protein
LIRVLESEREEIKAVGTWLSEFGKDGVTEEHFEKARRLPVEAVQNAVQPVQKAVQDPAANDRSGLEKSR